MTVGEKIRAKRIELGMSQEELAKKLGYKSRSSINKFELSRDLPLNKVQEVAKALNCDAYDLIDWGFLDAPPQLSPETAERDFMLVDTFSKLNYENQQIILDMIDSMLKRQK